MPKSKTEIHNNTHTQHTSSSISDEIPQDIFDEIAAVTIKDDSNPKIDTKKISDSIESAPLLDKSSFESNIEKTIEKPLINNQIHTKSKNLNNNAENLNAQDKEKEKDKAEFKDIFNDSIDNADRDILSSDGLGGGFLEDSEEIVSRHYKKSLNYLLYSKRLLLGIIIFASFIGLYSGYLIFGNVSIESLLRLQQQKEEMANQVEQNKIENAILQKKLLELQSLEPK